MRGVVGKELLAGTLGPPTEERFALGIVRKGLLAGTLGPPTEERFTIVSVSMGLLASTRTFPPPTFSPFPHPVQRRFNPLLSAST